MIRDSQSTISDEFFRRVLAEQVSSADVFRITITSFLDAYNFDVRRLMKCCIHHVLPSGHIIPFCALQCSVPGRTRAIACTPLVGASDRLSA